jgi:hypothetical protein
MPLCLHMATRRQGRIHGAGDKTLRDASSGATKAFYPALSLCDLIFSGKSSKMRCKAPNGATVSIADSGLSRGRFGPGRLPLG